MSRQRTPKSYKEPSSDDLGLESSDDEPVVKKPVQKKAAAKAPKQPTPAKRPTPIKRKQASSSSSSSSDDDDEFIVAPKKQPAAKAAAAAPRSTAKIAAQKNVIKIDSDSSSSPPPPARAAPKAKAPPSEKAGGSDSDDDDIIIRPKVKPVKKAEVSGYDSDDALLSMIGHSKGLEPDDDGTPRAHAGAAKTRPAPVAGDDDARLHPALQPLPDDLSKRAAKSSLPLTGAPAQKLQHVLVQCDEDCADLAGDSGVIGRFKYCDGRMLLDLKGYMYEGSLVPCCSLAVVHMKPTEARVEAVLDDFMALKQIGNVYDKEVAHGNMGSDDDGSDGIVLTDDEEGLAPAADGAKSHKEQKSKKSPSSSKPKSSSKSSKAKSSKSKPQKSKTKPSKPVKKTLDKNVATPKSGQAKKGTSNKSAVKPAKKMTKRPSSSSSSSSSNDSDSDYVV